MTVKTVKQLKQRLEAERRKIASSRDALRVLMDDAEELCEDADDAEDDLIEAKRLIESAADRLSSTVYVAGTAREVVAITPKGRDAARKAKKGT